MDGLGASEENALFVDGLDILFTHHGIYGVTSFLKGIIGRISGQKSLHIAVVEENRLPAADFKKIEECYL